MPSYRPVYQRKRHRPEDTSSPSACHPLPPPVEETNQENGAPVQVGERGEEGGIVAAVHGPARPVEEAPAPAPAAAVAAAVSPPGLDNAMSVGSGDNDRRKLAAQPVIAAETNGEVRLAPPRQQPETKKRTGIAKGTKWTLKETSDESNAGDDEGSSDPDEKQGGDVDGDDIWRPVGPAKDEVKDAWSAPPDNRKARIRKAQESRGGAGVERRAGSSPLDLLSSSSSSPFSSSSEDDGAGGKRKRSRTRRRRPRTTSRPSQGPDSSPNFSSSSSLSSQIFSKGPPVASPDVGTALKDGVPAVRVAAPIRQRDASRGERDWDTGAAAISATISNSEGQAMTVTESVAKRTKMWSTDDDLAATMDGTNGNSVVVVASETRPATETMDDFSPFPAIALQFLESAGVKTVSDLLSADSRALAKRLYESDGFRLGCALTALEFKQTLDADQALRLARLATDCVERWKADLARWMGENHGANMAQSLRNTVRTREEAAIPPHNPHPQMDRPSPPPPPPRMTPMDVPLTSLLSTSDCTFLRNHFGIVCAGQLLHANIATVVQRLRACLMRGMASGSDGRKDIKEEFCHGIVYSWMVKVREAIPPRTSGEGSSGPGGSQIAPWQNGFVPQNFPSQQRSPPFVHPRIAHHYPQQQYQMTVPSNRYAAIPDRMHHFNGHHVPSRQQAAENRSTGTPDTQRPRQMNATMNTVITVPPDTATNTSSGGRGVANSTGILAAQQPRAQKSASLRTPVSYDHLLFLRSQGIVSDEQLLSTDRKVLAFRYDKYRSLEGAKMTARAEDVVGALMASASKVLGRPRTQTDNFIGCECHSKASPPQEDPPLMDEVAHLCKTTVDATTGLPRREITSYDCHAEVLYDFVVEIHESTIPGAGLGAFLTFTGARELRAGLRKIVSPSTAITRKALEAIIPENGRGVSVTIEGKNLHGDEDSMGGKGCFGIRNEYSEKDFVACRDNVAFSSHDAGSGLVELGRYAPWIKHDRKTDLVFAVKDFVFSFEPSSWRFDVRENLYGYPQVVDFTSDVNGEPHDVAKKNIAMYVNEVGHNEQLFENVVSRDDRRTVKYYLFLHKAIQKGETVELLLDYDLEYEGMRERKGYGKANLHAGMKCDKDDCARLKRNLQERGLLESDILAYREKDLEHVTTFIDSRMLDAIKVATTKSLQETNSSITPQTLRQWVALRRLHFISLRLASHLKDSSNGNGCSNQSIDSIFPTESIVYVNGYAPPGEGRAEFSGIATVDSISLNAKGTHMYSLLLEGNKRLQAVPEGALTHPTEEEASSASPRSFAAWKKQKEAEEKPKKTRRMLSILARMRWDSSNDNAILSSAKSPHPQIREICNALHEELSEEALFVLSKEQRLVNPYDKRDWCDVSISLLRTLLRCRTVHLLSGGSETKLAEEIYSAARKAAEMIRKKSAGTDSVESEALAFEGNGSRLVSPEDDEKRKVYIVDKVEQCVIVTGRSKEASIHAQWYIMNQIISVAHSVASIVAWTQDYGSTTGGVQSEGAAAYSLEELCDKVGRTDWFQEFWRCRSFV